ncbi:hypothetical protein F5Y06DRAFT_293647 [Hypoxylon sp. FL0890]|nr:hypothetical protein F5Y06DRAFT_293647 [Hypoxylon sp. FL0890]
MSALLLLFLAVYVHCHDFPKPMSSLAMFNRTASSRSCIHPIWLNSTNPVPTTMRTVAAAPRLSGWDRGTGAAGTYSIITSPSINSTGTPRWSNTSYSAASAQLPMPTTPGLLAISYSTNSDPSLPTAITFWSGTEGIGISETSSWPLENVDSSPGSSATSSAVVSTQSNGSLVSGSSLPITTTKHFASTRHRHSHSHRLPTNGTSSSSTQPPPSTSVEVSTTTSTTTAILTITAASTTTTSGAMITTTSMDYSDVQLHTTSPTTTATNTVKVHPMGPQV